MIEAVNRRAARYVQGDYRRRSSVDEMLKSLGWSTLEDRRRDTRLALLFKILNDDIAVSLEDIHVELTGLRASNRHKFHFKHKFAKTEELKNFFTHDTLKAWNALPASVVEASTIDSFKARLSGHRSQVV